MSVSNSNAELVQRPNRAITTEWGESRGSKLTRKFKEAPFVPIGMAGCLGCVGYAIYAYKNKGRMSTSVFLIHLRVRAQAMVVGALTCGVLYNMVSDAMKKEDPKG